MSRFPILLLALTAAPALAQEPVPDTTAPWRYYPLGVGDLWQYRVVVEPAGLPMESPYWEEREVMRVTMVDGRTYAFVEVRRWDIPIMPSPPSPRSDYLVRFDTAAATALKEERPEDYPVDAMGCRLDEAFPADPEEGRAIACPNDFGDQASVMYGGYERSIILGGQTYTGTVKEFSYFTFGWQHSAYAAGIGLLSGGGCEGGCYEETLQYARVDGVEYGVYTVATEPEAEPRALAVRAEPNPIADALALTLDLPAAGSVAVEVFDALGRRAARHEAGLGAGRQALRLDAAGWAPGLYTARATVGGAAATARVVRR